MSDQDLRKFRAVNPSLGRQPKIGPFPAEQAIPWTVILFTSYYVCKVVFRLSWLWTGIVAGWGIATWWVLTGSKSWRFLSKFVSTPTWTRGYGRYQRVLNINIPQSVPKSQGQLSAINEEFKKRG